MKIVSFQQIADSLGISKQAVDNQYVKKGYLAKNKFGKIDIDNADNRLFLESKGADFSVFYADKEQKVIQKPVEVPSKPDKTPAKNSRFETNNELSPSQKLDLKIKLQSLKAKEADTHLKKIKIEELQGKLIPRDLAERYIADTIGAFSQSLISLPFAVVDNIFSIMTESTKKREDLITLLQEKYTKEMSRAAERGYKKFKRDLKERIQEQEQIERNGSEQDR